MIRFTTLAEITTLLNNESAHGCNAYLEGAVSGLMIKFHGEYIRENSGRFAISSEASSIYFRPEDVAVITMADYTMQIALKDVPVVVPVVAANNAAPFTANDWNGFAGASKWKDGASPLIRHLTNCFLVADPTGSTMIYGEEGDGDMTIHLDFPTQGFAAAFLNGLPDDFDAEHARLLGFDEL